MPRHRRRLWPLAILALSAIACGPPRTAGAGGAAEILIIFRNESLNQADLFVVGSVSEQARVGSVYGNHTDTLSFDLRSVSGSGTLSMLARVRQTGRVVRSPLVALHKGDILRVTLPMSETMLNALVIRPEPADSTEP
ncbi:MAG TPA: hypothetical protein VHM30_11680 [Gemmatimonadaceae bacterium]|nr:hypothetical protein [Gemmatimonadaceae bacterium]